MNNELNNGPDTGKAKLPPSGKPGINFDIDPLTGRMYPLEEKSTVIPSQLADPAKDLEVRPSQTPARSGKLRRKQSLLESRIS